MSFNIRYGNAKDGDNHWEKRKELVFDIFRDHQPDIVGLQEALRFQIDEILEVLPDYAFIGIGRDPGSAGEYSALLYDKKRFRILEHQTFWLSDTPEVPSASWGNKLVRICTYAPFGRWTGFNDGAKIDYVFVAPEIEVLDAEIVHDNQNGRYPSDHYPVRARIRF